MRMASSYKVIMENLVTFLLTALCFFWQTSNCEDYSSCGLRSVHRGKIFGGLQSRPGMWPWQVAIFRRTSDDRQSPQFFCGGALINSRWVLSAAHCFHKHPHEPDYRYTIKAGDHKILSKDPHEQERNVFRIHNHPNFIPRTYENDIALMELNKGVIMGPKVRSICLPKPNENLSSSGGIVRVAGWGFTTKGPHHSSVLLHSAFKIQSNKNCTDTTRYLFNETVMFCAGHGEGGNDTCKGDSGGSTVREVSRDGRQRWVTVGLVSWGEKCGIKGKYGYYTRVEPFVNWIQKKINGSILSCGHPGNITNGRMNDSDFLVGFTVRYTCIEGYRLRGRARSRCRRNGKWTKVPSCKKVECRDPGRPHNGVRRPRRNKFHYKEKIRFRCKTNYTLIGRSSMRCQSDGTWSGFKPACLAPCKDPGIPIGGARLDHNFKHGHTVRFMCRKKNQPPSLSYLTCNNGRWSRNIPRCMADCDDPGIPVNGQRRGNDFTVKKRVFFTCGQGYMRVGPEYLECQRNRRWSDTAPTCEPLSCTRPTPPENAHILSRRQLKEKYGFNEVVMFQCNKGYRSFGSPFVKCLTNGWSKTNLRCPPIDCGRLKTPRHGEKVEETSTSYGSKVVFQCTKNGFELKGSRQRVCQANGDWSGNETTCEGVSCSTLTTPGNGERDPVKKKYVYEDTVTFRCATNYTLIGQRSIICQHDKTWSNVVPRCLAPCRDPGIPIGGRRYQNSFIHNDTVQFGCKRGWSMEGSHTIRCTDGRWDHPTPTCSEGCPTPGRPDNGGIYRNTWKNFYNHKDRVRFYCSRDYKLVGNEYATCRNGDWTSDPPECKRICGNPGRLANGGFSGSEFFEGREIRFYYCYRGYDLIGSQTQRCLSTGRWSARRPECKLRCYNPWIPSNDVISNPSLVRGYRSKHGTVISFSCTPRYTLVGQQTIRCDNGRWSHGVPVCKAPCLDPGELQYGRKNGANFLHGNQVRYNCLGMYMIEGATLLTCNDGRWDRRKPSCKGSCQVPNNFGAGVISSPRVTSRQRIKHGTRVSFSCWDSNKLLDGDREITCNDGTWSNPKFPMCKVPCSDPGPIGNGTRRSTNFTVEYECFHGYTLVGSSRRDCVGGRWRSYAPRCLKNCPDPGAPTNGYKTGTDYGHGKRVFYRCTGRTRLKGSSSLTCNDGQWSSPIPKCLEICPAPNRIINGRYLVNGNGKWEYLSGEKVVYKCYSGYDLVGNRELHCERGRWNGSAPVCADRCRMARNPTGVKFVTKPRGPGVDFTSPSRLPQAFKHGTVLVFSCDKNKVLNGPSEIFCNKGRWSKGFPKCEDCVMVGSRVVANWGGNPSGGYIYYKAFLTSISKRYWKVELENENHDRPAQKYMLKYTDLPFVLDVPPKHEELQVGTRVLAPWSFRYYTSSIKTGRDRHNRYRVRADDGDEKDFTIDQLRLLKAPTFCN